MAASITITQIDGLFPSGDPEAPTAVPKAFAVTGMFNVPTKGPTSVVKCKVGAVENQSTPTPTTSPWTVNFAGLPVTPQGETTSVFATVLTLDGTAVLAITGPFFVVIS